MERDWIFRGEDYQCGFRTAGVLIKDGKLLVQRDAGGTEYALPGGHVKIGESSVESLVREYREETGVDIVCGRLLWTEECFWTWNGTPTHTVVFYYLISLVPGQDIPDSGKFTSQKDNCNVQLGWVPLETIKALTIYPSFLKDKLFHLDGPAEHFITRE